MRNPDQMESLKMCSFPMLCGFWCDLFMIVIGVQLLDEFPIVGTGLIIFHLAFLMCSVLHRKLGFTYNITMSRVLVLITDIICFAVFLHLYSNYPPRCKLVQSYVQTHDWRREGYWTPKGIPQSLFLKKSSIIL